MKFKTIGKILISFVLAICILLGVTVFSGSQFCWGDPNIDNDNNGVADNCFVTSE